MANKDRARGNRNNKVAPPKPQAAPSDPLAELARLIGQQNEAAPLFGQQAAPSRHDSEPAASQAGFVPVPPAAPAPQPQKRYRQDDGAPNWPDTGSARVSFGDSRYDPYQAARQKQPDPGAASSYPEAAASHPESYDEPHQAAPSYPEGQYADPQYPDPQYPDSPQYPDAPPYPNQASYPGTPSYPDAPPYGEAPFYGDARYSDPRFGDPRYASEDQYRDPRYDSDPQQDDPRYGGHARYDDRYGDPRYADGAQGQGYAGGPQRYAEPQYPAPVFAAPNFGVPGYGAGTDSNAGYAADPRRPAHGGYQDRPESFGDSYFGAPTPAAAMEEAAPRRGSFKYRGNIVTVLAVLALAVVGTATAFGYRAMFGGPGSPVPPPVIKADTQPSKIVPATDPNNKPIQDRIGVKTEKIVPRQEEPLQQAAPGQGRVIAPFLAGQNPQAFPSANAKIVPGTGAATPAAGEPKRIKTIPIKPQGADAAPGPRSSRTAPEDTAAVDNASMALAATGSLPPSQRAAARQAHAALTPNDAGPGSSAFPTPLSPSASPARAAPGPFAVQVTSQRSEADAQASFRSLQQQFPSVLGSRQPVIRRADLGERGTYYRAQIPFSSQSEASEFCSSLKSAGGQCVVQRN